MKNSSYKFAVFVVFCLAFLVRIYKISDFPVSLSMDEAAIGYNAYSIYETGHDEWGEYLPLAFRSANDYKPPVNVYLTVPSIMIFGMNEFAVRFPVVLIGALSAVVVVGLLQNLGLSRSASVLSGIWFGLNPWHIHFSRGSFEAVTGLFFVLLGTLFFVKWLKENTLIQLILSVSFFGISVWSYHAQRVFTPILFLFLIVSSWKVIARKSKGTLIKQIKISLIPFLILAIPFVILTFFTPAIKQRAASTSFLRDTSLSQNLHKEGYQNIFEFIFDNDFYLIFRHWAGKYLRYFDFRFWFWKGLALTPPAYPGLGLLYLVDFPLFFLGIYALFKSKNKGFKNLVVFWFFAGPFAASLTMNEMHPLRALIWLPFFVFVISFGFEHILRKKNVVALGFYFISLLVNIYYSTDIYFKQFPKYFSEYWQYGFKDIALYICESYQKYDHVVITDTFGSKGPLNTSIPSYYVLFYCEDDREMFVKTGKHLDEIAFRRPNYISDNKLKNALRVGSVWDFDGEVINEEDVIKRFCFMNGDVSFIAVDKEVEKDESN